jgi:spore coat protein SA
MRRALVISPGVLPLPPVLGGAVENLIARLHPALCEEWEMEYISVKPPPHNLQKLKDWSQARFHYIESIDPLRDFTEENQFELHECAGWQEYLEFCVRVSRERLPCLIHIHNEAHLIAPLRRVLPSVRLLLHVNDEVVTRMHRDELQQLSLSCDCILACSEYIAKQMNESFNAAGIRPPPMRVFYNFVDVDEYSPAAVKAGEVAELRRRLDLGPGPLLLFVGRMIEQKGPHLALQAFRRVLPSHPGAHVLFVGAPWYSRQNQSPFVELLRSEAIPIADRVRFAGYVDHTQMPVYYALANVVCAPSIWDDPSPFVAYEAQAMARPLVTSRRGGIPEIVQDRVTARCIDVFNTLLFAQILDDWFRYPELAREVGEAGRARVQDRFDLHRAQREIATIYSDLAAAPGEMQTRA